MYFLKLFFLFTLCFTLQAKEQELESVTLQLQWKHQFEFAGFYAAKEMGYYEEAGLDVSFKEYEKDMDIIDEVLQDNAQYGLSYSSIIAEYLNGKPILFVANFFKQSPLVLVTQEKIKTPSDLKNKKVMGVSNSIDNITLLMMLNKFDVNLEDIQTVPASFNLDMFIDKNISAMSVFTTNELYHLNKKGVKYNLFDPTVYGASYYDVNLFTSQQELKEHPLRIKKFKEASIKGWEYALNHQHEIIQLILKKYNSQQKTEDALYFEAKQIEQIMLPNVYDIGSIDINRVKTIADTFRQSGFIKADTHLKVASFIYNDFSNLLNLTRAEIQFLKDHPKIVLGTEKKWEPYVIISNSGDISGYDADVLQLINNVSGANFILEAGAWAEMQTHAKNRKIDGLSTGGIHKEREKYLNFSDIYITMKKMLITSIDNPKNIHTLDDLDGKTIAIHKSNLVDEKTAQKFKNSTILRLDKIEDVITHVVTGKADAMFGNGSTFYLANEMGIPYLKRSALLKNNLELAFGVRNDWPEAISIINKALEYIGEHKLLSLKKRWFFSDANSGNNNLQLTVEELEYLQNKQEIKICIDPDWMPFEAMIDGKYRGMNAEFLNIFETQLNIPINIVKTQNWSDSIRAAKERKCDLLSLAMPTKERTNYLNFSTSYIEVPLIIVSKSDKRSVIDITLLEKSKIAVVKDYALVDIIANKYPNLEVIEVNNIQEGLQKVDNGDVFGFAGTSVAIEYYFQEGDYETFKTVAHFDEKLSLGVGIRNDDSMLYTILQKAIHTLSKETKESILKRWLYMKYEQKFDYILFYQLLAVIFLILLIAIYRHLSIKKINRELTHKMQEELKKSQDKDRIIFQQNKLAAMGEMIENIAHQWRQPLSQVNSSVLVLDGLLEQKNIHDTQIESKLQEIESLTLYMSTTIDDFKNFFSPTKKQEIFVLNDIIAKSAAIIESTLKHHNILLQLPEQNDITLTGYPNELQQAILVILNNAKDVLVIRKTANAKITISVQKEHEYLTLIICDNAGGINENIINKIFDSYFSTKKSEQAMGIGLYISKIIIETNMKGTLNVHNSSKGACFTITLPYDITETI